MATVIRTWKCALCSKGFRSKTEANASMSRPCPECGAAMALVRQEEVQPADANFPTPQPRPVNRSGKTAPQPSSKVSSRPADPAAAIAAISSSSAWAPPGDHGPSANLAAAGRRANRLSPLDELASFASGALDTASASQPSSSVLKSPLVLASVGGVLAILVVVVLAMRGGSKPAAAVADNSPAATVPAPVAPLPAAPMAPTVNLLSQINPARDTRGGQWKLEAGQLYSDSSHRAKLVIPYKPTTAEYDFTIEFTRTGGDNCIAQIFTHHQPIALVLGGWKGEISGLQRLGGQSASGNPTGTKKLKWETGVRYVSKVMVRRDHVEVWVNGERLLSYKSDGSDFGNQDWDVGPAQLAIGTEMSPATFHKIELVEFPAAGE